ncbi:alpha-galactosidase [Pontibacillus salipaludis]|uniref:Alpha-galactosidase n=1 Tax=Pontibacillus salipaludis TaxID=1697394 RepID=A0ABQ1Q4G1_9BACI|nr:alpha-galactosidase [Pontibacillus salipaludis]GGD12971.1 alpha-galactosidase [Pontibacillus salipaludis]
MIEINESTKQFHLTNGRVSYIMNVMKNGQLGHLYYGKALRPKEDFSYFQPETIPTPASCHVYEDDDAFSLETMRQEFPLYGNGDFREPAMRIESVEGVDVTRFQYKGYERIDGKSSLEGLPASYASEGDASSLVIVLKEQETNLELSLIYTIFRNHDVIARSVKVRNSGEQPFYIHRVMGASVDFPDRDYELFHLSGSWSRERHLVEKNLDHGSYSIGSVRGASSHHHNPFLGLKRKDSTENRGEVYGFSFIYSGNFIGNVEVDHYDVSRVMMGIHPSLFKWTLEPGQKFQSPEVVMVYSDEGLNGMSQSFHDFYKQQLISPRWKEKDRPILINNWEATYFDFNEEKLFRIAEDAKSLGIELFVLDDGWFGKRNNDKSSLGDWVEDPAKLPNGLESLADGIRSKGLQFGLWFEPEMVSPNSDLYRAHPEWAIGVPEQPLTLGRNQLVLDFSRQDVVDYIDRCMSDIIERTKLSYIKWDMNRNITEAYSANLAASKQGEFFHRYILGVYELYQRLTEKFPDVLFESCAGGGGRFDPGMLYYAPQAWSSDNTDAIERLKIQYGTSMVYPIYSMGSHVSATPNHQTLRTTPLDTRANVAYFGTFGYELNPVDLSEEEKEQVKDQVSFYKQNRALVRDGDFYRLLSPFDHNETAWMVVSKDKKEALVGWYKTLATPNDKKMSFLPLKGLDEDTQYQLNHSKTFFGDELMNHGLPLPVEFNGVNGEIAERGGDFQSMVFHIKAE